MHMFKKKQSCHPVFPPPMAGGVEGQRIPPSYPVVDPGLESWRTCLRKSSQCKSSQFAGSAPQINLLAPEERTNNRKACNSQARTHPGPRRPAARLPPGPHTAPPRALDLGLRRRGTWAAPRSPRSRLAHCPTGRTCERLLGAGI